jgi:hypothetical protein
MRIKRILPKVLISKTKTHRAWWRGSRERPPSRPYRTPFALIRVLRKVRYAVPQNVEGECRALMNTLIMTKVNLWLCDVLGSLTPVRAREAGRVRAGWGVIAGNLAVMCRT